MVIIKTTLREIRQSLGRYIAILAIVALGVGFFAGLKAAKPAMVDAVEGYLNTLNFYDFRLLSTLGFNETDIETFQEQKDVETAAGSYSFDIICENAQGDNSFVVKTHSITEGVNTLYRAARRSPEGRPAGCRKERLNVWWILFCTAMHRLERKSFFPLKMMKRILKIL